MAQLPFTGRQSFGDLAQALRVSHSDRTASPLSGSNCKNRAHTAPVARRYPPIITCTSSNRCVTLTMSALPNITDR